MPFPISASLLDACVLALLSQEDMYGYLLTQNIQAMVDVSESTLYPVLRRLQKDRCLTTYDMAYQGRNRRYYAITDLGRNVLKEYRREWMDYKQRMDQLLLEGANHHE